MALELGAEALAVEDVVAEHEAAGVAVEEVGTDGESLGEALGFGLDGVADRDPELGPVAQEALERVLFVRGVDHQHLRDAREDQGGERVVDHGLVVDGDELLAAAQGDGVKSRAGAAGQDDSAHG